MAHMALEMQRDASREYRERTGERIELRIGIGTGPVVAGVIGKKKFIYDMWGDTVNVAFRMAADAYSGAIQVDLTTYRRLHNRFHFDEAHEVEIKGKGRMQVFHLLGPIEAEPAAQVSAPGRRIRRRHSVAHRAALRPPARPLGAAVTLSSSFSAAGVARAAHARGRHRPRRRASAASRKPELAGALRAACGCPCSSRSSGCARAVQRAPAPGRRTPGR